MGRPKKAVSMVLETENAGAIGCLIGADPLEDPKSVVKRVSENMNPGFLPGHHFAIEPNVSRKFREIHVDSFAASVLIVYVKWANSTLLEGLAIRLLLPL
jgi:hypothetical protein